MQPEEPRSFAPDPADIHTEIDQWDRDQLRYWAGRLSVTPEEVVEAVREVGPNPIAVAIWLGSADAV